MRSLLAALLGASLAVPGLASDEVPDRVRPAALEGSALTWCGDVEPIRADPGLYRDSPVYVGNPPAGRILRWARKQPGYVDAWIDRDNLGWITLAITESAGRRQQQLERRFPDTGVVAVEVEHSRKELQRLQRRIGREVFPLLRSGSSGIDPSANIVTLDVGELTAGIVGLLESGFAGEPFCIDGPDPSELVPDGPQLTAGDGWRLIGVDQGSGPSYRTGIATDAAQLAALWFAAEMPGGPPAAGFSDAVVLWFAEPHGSSCPDLRLDDVVVDLERSIVHPLIVVPDDPVACTDDIAGADQSFVVLERARLPAGPFSIQLAADDPPLGAPEERTVVEVDLTGPRSTAGAGTVHADPDAGTPRPLRSGAVIEPGYPRAYEFDVRCGIGYLGEVNGIHWVTGETELPEAWAALVDDDGDLVVRVRLRGGDAPRAIARANGTVVRYEPMRAAPAPCEG